MNEDKKRKRLDAARSDPDAKRRAVEQLVDMLAGFAGAMPGADVIHRCAVSDLASGHAPKFDDVEGLRARLYSWGRGDVTIRDVIARNPAGAERCYRDALLSAAELQRTVDEPPGVAADVARLVRRHFPGSINAELREKIRNTLAEHGRRGYADASMPEAIRLAVRKVALTPFGKRSLAALLADVEALARKAGAT